jgi:Zn-dependent peptidase ImmA (M78 family)
MFFLVRKFRKIRLNRHVFTEADVRRLCAENGVEIIEEELDQEGFYLKMLGRAEIHVNSELRGLRWMYVVLHELGHHLMHAVRLENAAFFFLNEGQQDSKQHHEAEAFALLALLPEPFLRRLLAGDLLNELEDYPKEIVLKRLRLLELYGI